MGDEGGREGGEREKRERGVDQGERKLAEEEGKRGR